MPALTPIEIGQFVTLFNRGGYVLNFSTNEFDVFTLQCVGVALCEKYRQSKGKSLIAYLNDADDEDRFKLIAALFEYYEVNYEGEFSENFEREPFTYAPSYNKDYSRQYKKCKEIMNCVSPHITPLAPVAEELIEKFSSEYLTKQINLMLSMQETNPTDAIGKAKELIESCCKTILDNNGVTWDKTWDVTKLTGETLKLLNLTPQAITVSDPVDEHIKAVLGNLRGIASKLSEIRNAYGSGHGKSASFAGLEARHAKLAVGCSITFVSFLWDTYEDRKNP